MSNMSLDSALAPLPQAQATNGNTQRSSDAKPKKKPSLIFAGAGDYCPGDLPPSSAHPDGTKNVKIVAAVSAFKNSPFTLPDLPLSQAQNRELEDKMKGKQSQSTGVAAFLNFGNVGAFASVNGAQEHGTSIYNGRYKYTYLDDGSSSRSYGGSFRLPVADNASVGLGYTGNDTKCGHKLETYYLHREPGIEYYYDELVEVRRGEIKEHTDNFKLTLNKGNISTNVVYNNQTGKRGELICTAGIQNLNFLRPGGGDPGFWPPSFGVNIEASTDKKACVNVTIGDLINAGYINKWGPDNYGQVYVTISGGLRIYP